MEKEKENKLRCPMDKCVKSSSLSVDQLALLETHGCYIMSRAAADMLPIP